MDKYIPRMDLRLILVTLTISIATGLIAQDVPDSLNMVVNGDFEQLDGKLKRLGGVEVAKGWESPTEAKADIYSETVADEAPAHVPKNAHGFQGALSGQNYAGVLWWSYMDKEPRTYLQVKFKRMLKKGQLYCIRYYVSLSDLSKYSSDQLGAYSSRIVVHKKDESSLTYEPQVPALLTKVYDDMDGWQGVCGVYEAKGDEQYLLIGNFASTEKTTTVKMKRPRGETRAQQANAYYFIDDVSVTPIKRLSECSCEQIDETKTEFIYGVKVTADPNIKPADRLDRSVIYFKRYSTSLDASMKPLLANLADAMKNDPSIKVRLVGHMDEIEVDRSRLRPDLAQMDTQRAEQVRSYFTDAGIAADRITVAGRKGDSPASDGKDEISLSKNRRVEVDVVK
jgi:outer membrane protein OmpA-like peptidoglycan-associated protein